MCTPSSVEVVEVIFVSTSRGDGTPGNPHRSVFQYWSKDGHLLAESDSLFEDPERASYYAVERLMQLRGIPWEAEMAGKGARETPATPADTSITQPEDIETPPLSRIGSKWVDGALRVEARNGPSTTQHDHAFLEGRREWAEWKAGLDSLQKEMKSFCTQCIATNSA